MEENGGREPPMEEENGRRESPMEEENGRRESPMEEENGGRESPMAEENGGKGHTAKIPIKHTQHISAIQALFPGFIPSITAGTERYPLILQQIQ